MGVLVGKPAPHFSAKAVIHGKIVERFSLADYMGEQYVVLFFYPKDFTFVCPTELISFQNNLEAFEARNTAVVACSTDSEFSHYAWVHTPKHKGGIEGVTYPIVADINKTIADAYDVLAGSYTFDDGSEEVHVSGELVAYRGLFLIDKKGIVQHQLINNMPLGRSIQEVLRMIDALQHFEQYGEVCPANWQKGDLAMETTFESLSATLERLKG